MEEENKNPQGLQETISVLKNENSSLRKEIQELKSVENPGNEQAEFQESQMRFRTVFELSTLGNKIISRDLKIIQVNPALVALLGYDAIEFDLLKSNKIL